MQALEANLLYDKCYAKLNLLLCLLGSLLNKDQWSIQLHEHVDLEFEHKLSPTIIKLIKRYLPVALCLDTFLETLRKKSKSTPYPENELQKLSTFF